MADPRSVLDPRRPVLVGLGAASDPAPVAELMTQAVLAAAEDAGAPGLLSGVDRIVVPQGSWALTDPGRTVARRIGSPHARSVLCEVGVSQQELINHALAAIAAGECDTVVVVGAEARAWARAGGTESDGEDAPPDEVLSRPPDFIAPIEIAAGTAWPVVQQYALIENALNAMSDDPAAERAHMSALWARFNEVARGNPSAAFPVPLTTSELATPGPDNRPLAYPYNYWHSSQWTVDQSSALLLCSAERALAAGIPADRWIFPHVALHCSSALTLTARRRLATWPAMGVLGDAAAATHLGRPLRDLPLTEVYSCFPVAVRLQQRELGLDPLGTPTLTGGMAFAGGPFNHYVLLSTVTVGRRLREEPSELGLVTTVSGILSKPGLALWSCSPPESTGIVADLADEAVAASEVAPVREQPLEQPTRGVVVSYTVTYGGPERMDPERTVVVADLPDGVRMAATCEDALTAQAALKESLIGRTVELKDTTFRI